MNVSRMRATDRFMRSARHSRSRSTAPFGSVCVMMQSIAARTWAISGASRAVSRYTGAKPAERSSVLRSRSGMSRALASTRSISRLGADLPFSMKLMCRVETSASTDRSSWLFPRDVRQCLRSSPTAPARTILGGYPRSRRPDMTSEVMVEGPRSSQSLGMKLSKILLPVLLAGFSALTAEVVIQDGCTEWLRIAFANRSAGLLLVDLSIALSLVLAWMVRDARQRKAIVWPFAILTVALGSVGPLAYLVVRAAAQRRANDADPAASAVASRAGA